MDLMKITVFVVCVIFMALHGVNGDCSSDQWACKNGQCIPASWKCDVHWVDCADGSDEFNCPVHTDPELPADAEQVCGQSDQTLSKVISAERLDLSLEELQEVGYSGNVWVDGTIHWGSRLVEFSDGSVTFISNIDIWHDGEPNQSGNCLHLSNNGQGHKLDDTSCDYPQGFMCGEPDPVLNSLPEQKGEAEAYCTAIGKALYTVNTQHTLNAAISELQYNGITTDSIWVDGRVDWAHNVVSFTDVSAMAIDNIDIWHIGEPNGSGDCLQLWNNGNGYALDDTPCDPPQASLCA